MSNQILIIAAHPDDEVLGCSATVADLIKKGDSAYALILCKGKLARDNVKEGELEELHSELIKASKVIGINNVFQADFPCNSFDAVPLLKIVKEIERIKKIVKPNVVFTHFAHDINIDHRITFNAVLTATRPIKGETVETLYSMEIFSSTEWNTYDRGTMFVPNYFYNIEETIDLKLKALSCYQSELRDYPHPRSLEHVKRAAQFYGAQVGLNYCERFQIVRSINGQNNSRNDRQS